MAVTGSEVFVFSFGGILGGGLALFFLLGIAYLLFEYGSKIKAAYAAQAPTIGIGSSISADWILKYSPMIIFGAILITFFSLYIHYSLKNRYRENPEDIKVVKTTKREELTTAIQSLPRSLDGITNLFARNDGRVSAIPANNRALVNFRPLCAQNTGYYGGLDKDEPYRDGVYDVDVTADAGQAIPLSIRLGAKAFVLDIDYLEKTPCAPVLMYRDKAGFRRSLNTGSVRQTIQQIANSAFDTNLDPVLLILYFRRVPPDQKQFTKFFKAVALALNPIAPYHLGQTALGSFNKCAKERSLFTTPIGEFQKKIIVLTNVNTFEYDLPNVTNPKESLHFYTNARIFADINANDRGALGYVTKLPPENTIPAVVVGSANEYISRKGTELETIRDRLARGTFVIAMRNHELEFKDSDISTLLNVCQIQCVPLDVINLGARDQHRRALGESNVPTTLTDISTVGNVSGDPLAYWRLTCWTPKLVRVEGSPGGSTDYKYYYVIPAPTPPMAPNLATNANGGNLNISI